MGIRVLVADDSAFMRQAIKVILEDDPDIEVVATARDGVEAIEKVKQLKPDVLTTDIHMPRLSGISVIKALMQENPLPVLVISSITAEEATETIQAMEAGAVDVITKQMTHNSLNILKLRDELIPKVKEIACTHSQMVLQPDFPAQTSSLSRGHLNLPCFPSCKLVVIGVSTGGPFSLQKVIPNLPSDFPRPVIIVQHMPPYFTRSLAQRLNDLSHVTVVEAAEGMKLQEGWVYVAPGGYHLHLTKDGTALRFHISKEPAKTLFRPSVDVTLSSVHQVMGGKVLVVIMTGMGRDGLEGVKKIKQSGGKVIAQDKSTSVVYGMPRVVTEANLADAVLPLEKIAGGMIAALS